MSKSRFSGFHPACVQFLDELSIHNHREWFQKNKSRYESDVLAPSLAFIEAMQAPLAKLSPHFTAVPKRIGGSLMRIYRDTRFAKDKTPYKTNVGIQFRHVSGSDVHAPCYYVHIAPEGCFIGCGIWHPDSNSLKRIRKTIDADPGTWKRATQGKTFREEFELVGDSLKRPPQGYPSDHPWIEDLRRKDYLAHCDVEFDELFDAGLVSALVRKFKKASPLMRFLCDAMGVDFDAH